MPGAYLTQRNIRVCRGKSGPALIYVNALEVWKDRAWRLTDGKVGIPMKNFKVGLAKRTLLYPPRRERGRVGKGPYMSATTVECDLITGPPK